MTIDEQCNIILSEWYNRLPAERQTHEALWHMQQSVKEFHNGTISNREYAYLYTNESWVKEIDEWIRFIYPTAVIIKVKWYYVCLNARHVKDLKERMQKDMELIRKELDTYEHAMEHVEDYFNGKARTSQ